MFDEMQHRRRSCARWRGTSSATSATCCGFCWARSASCCWSPARTSPTCSWCARKAGSRSWRCAWRSAPAACRWSRELLAESAAPQRWSPGRSAWRWPTAASGCSLALNPHAAAAPGRNRARPHRHRCSCWRPRSSRRCCSASSRSRSTRTRSWHDAQGKRPRLERRPRAASRAQHAGRGAGRAGRWCCWSASGLMIRTFLAMRDVQPGFTAPGRDPHDAHRHPRDGGQGRPAGRGARTSRSSARIEAIPGVTSVGLSSSMHDGRHQQQRSGVRGGLARRPRGRCRRSAATSGSAPSYFGTMGNPLVAGRDFTWDDVQHRAPVAIVSENARARVLRQRGRGARPSHPQQPEERRGAKSSAWSATSARTA